MGRNGSSGVLILSIFAPEKSRGNKKCDKEEELRHIFGLFGIAVKMAVTWLYATLLISICSFCRGQHVMPIFDQFCFFFRFSGVAKNRP